MYSEDSVIIKNVNTNCKLENNISVVKYNLQMQEWLVHCILLSRCGQFIMAKLKLLKLTIGVKFEVNVKKWGRWSCFCRFFYLNSLGNINGIQIVKFGLLIDRTSSIYLKVRLKALTSVIFLFWLSFGINSASSEYRKRSAKKRGTVGSHGDVNDLLKNSELDEYVVDKELQHTEDFIFCVSLFALCIVPKKISLLVTQNYKLNCNAAYHC